MDWNWFFSSLSQSAAAIVGIFGAFIITKILSNQAAFSTKENRIKDLLAGGEKVKDGAESLYFEWYNEQKNEAEFRKIDKILEENPEYDANKLYGLLGFSLYVSKNEVVKVIEKKRITWIARRKREQEAKDREYENIVNRGGGFRGVGVPGTTFPVNIPVQIYNPELFKQIVEVHESIDEAILDAKHHIRLVSDFLETARGNPESSMHISYALVLVTVLFYVGVIYPLSFMPMPQNATIILSFEVFWPLLFSLKGLLLAAVSLVFTSALAMFFMMNLRMKYPQDDLNKLEALTQLGAYSEYFAIMEANKKQQS